MNKEINYKGTELEEVYKLALIGADFIAEKNENGVTIANSLNKQLYTRTVLLSRFLNVIALPEDRVMSLEQYNIHNIAIGDFKGRGVKRLKADFEVFKDMLDTEISNIMASDNDVINRINEVIANDLTPEKIENLKKQSDALLKELEKVNE